MSEKFVLLTEEDYNNYMKLKEQQENNKNYHKNYLKNVIQEAKINNQEKYKLLMQKQNEKNKKYKKQALQNLKQDEQKYNEYRLKINNYNKQLRQRKKEILINSVVAI